MILAEIDNIVAGQCEFEFGNSESDDDHFLSDRFNIIRGLIKRLSFAFQMEFTFIERLNSSEVDSIEYQIILTDKEKVKFTAKFISEHYCINMTLLHYSIVILNAVVYFIRTMEEIVEKKRSSTDIDDNGSVTTECSNISTDIES